MKKLSNLKWFTLGIAVCLFVTTLIIPAFASSLTKAAQLVYNDIKITLNGSAITPKDANGNTVEPFTIDGTTYLPVRAVANALGLSVDWDPATKTVRLTQGGTSGGAYNRTNPAPVGTTQTITIDNYSYKYTVAITTKEILSGQSMQTIMGSTIANDSPDSGCEIVAVKVAISLIDVSVIDKSVYFDDFDFDAFTGNNESLDHKYIYLTDEGYLDSTLYKGGKAEGYIIMQRKINDTGAKVVFGADYDGSGGIWFSIA